MVRRAVALVAVGLLGLALAPVGVTGAQTAGGPGRVDSEGWWNAAPAEAPVPITLPPIGVAPPSAEAPAPDVPEGAIAVGSRLGRPARIAALGIVLEAERGSTVTSFELQLKEAEGPFAQQGSDPKVQACPVTDFLIPEMGGPPTNVPEADCGLAKAEGVRADDGTWTFDLTAIASAWLDPFGNLQANGIRLDPVGEAPATFQVTFTGLEDAAITADIAPPAGAGEDPFGSSGGAFDAPVTSGGDFATPTIDVPPAEAPSVDTPTSEAPASGERVEEVVASRAGKTFGNWPLGVWLALLGALLLAVLTSLVLGPLGRHRTDLARRSGGTSRALGGRITAT